MISFFFKLFNATLSLSLLVFVYAVKSVTTIEQIIQHFGYDCCEMLKMYDIFSYIIYFAAMLMATWGLTLLFPHIGTKQEIPPKGIVSIEPVGDTFITSYLGYFFIALSIPNFTTLATSFLLLFVFILLSNIYLFNPLYLILGYRFFYAMTTSNKRVVILTKEKIQFNDNVCFGNLRKVNEFTFIDI